MFRSLQSRVTASLVALTAVAVVALGIGLSTLFGQVLANQYVSAYRSNASAMQAILNDSLQGIYYAGAIDAGRLRQVVDQLRDQFKFRVGVYLSGYNSAVADSGVPRAAAGSHAAVDTFPPLSFPLTYDG